MSSSSNAWLMGLDLGGGGVRCLLVDAECGARAVSARTWRFPEAEGTFGLGFDFDPELAWQYIAAASRDALSLAGIGGEQVAALAVSAVRFGNALVDASGDVLFAVPNRDARAAGESFALSNNDGEGILADTGLWPMPIHSSARLMWLKAQRPEVLADGVTLLSLSDWVNFRLCGLRAADYSQAGCTGLFDLALRDWSWSRIDGLDLPRELFPEARDSGTRLGGLRPDAAEALGLRPGAVVGLGGGDTQCGLLAAGAVASGDATFVAGTTAPLQLVVDTPTVDPEGRLWSGHHVVPGLWVLESNGGPMGETLSWMARLLFPDAPEPELRLLAEAATAEVGSAGMLSTLGAEVMNARAPSMPVGQITLTHMTSPDDPNPRRHLARSVVEGYACALRANLEALCRVTGLESEMLRIVGGLSRSPVFAQIASDVTGSEIQAAEVAESTALGAALCAGRAAGIFDSLPQAAAALAKTRESFRPDAARAEASGKLYDDWSKLREAGLESSAPAAAAHVTPWVLQSGAGDQSSNAQAVEPRPTALVTAAFDEISLEALAGDMQVEYASFREHMRLLRDSELVEALAGVQIFITEIDLIDASALAQLPELRVLASCRGEAVNVDVRACTAYGIPVLFAPGRNADAVADLSVAFALQLARQLSEATTFLDQPEVIAGNLAKMGEAFGRFHGRELWRKTVGLVGLGAVGRAVAKRFAGFGTRVLAADPFVSNEQAALVGARKVGLDELLRESDFVSLHAEVNEQTRGMIGRSALAMLKPDSFLINTARAALLDEHAVVEALESGQLAGAALDTFSVEPPGHDHPLVQHPRVISTPHIGGNTREVAAHQGEMISRDLRALLRGGRPRHLLNPQVLSDFDWRGARRVPSARELGALADTAGVGVSDLQRDAQRDD